MFIILNRHKHFGKLPVLTPDFGTSIVNWLFVL